jgi:hypothetical protein
MHQAYSPLLSHCYERDKDIRTGRTYGFSPSVPVAVRLTFFCSRHIHAKTRVPFPVSGLPKLLPIFPQKLHPLHLYI